jgi:AAA domain
VAHRELRIGTGTSEMTPATLPTFGPLVLICGPSQAGKSTLAHDLLRQLDALGYQCCVVDPEGDYYGSLDAAVSLGSHSTPVDPDEVLDAVRDAQRSVVCNLLGVSPSDRAGFLVVTLEALLEQRALTGAPHWILVDEAHHMLQSSLGPSIAAHELASMILVTVQPRHVARSILEIVTHVIALGDDPPATVAAYCRAAGAPVPPGVSGSFPASSDALLFDVRRQSVVPIEVGHIPKTSPRHARKYAEGDMGPERSFVFRGPHNDLDLRARNLVAFVALGAAVPDDAWEFHLRRGDFAGWIRDCVGDADLAADVDKVASERLSLADSREAVTHAIERRYAPPI